jgi:hypothetical protein
MRYKNPGERASAGRVSVDRRLAGIRAALDVEGQYDARFWLNGDEAGGVVAVVERVICARRRLMWKG